MSCNDPIYIVRGNNVNLPITLTQEALSFAFTCAGIVTPPAVGDIYTKTVSAIIDGQNTTQVQLIVTSVSGSVVTMQSLLVSNTDDNGVTIISATGSLTQVTGSGDATLTYTSFVSDNYVDTTRKTIKLRILKNVVDSPLPADIILDKNAIISSKGVGVFQYSVAETSAMPVGQWFGCIEIYTSTSNVLEQRDDEVFPVIINKNKI